MRRPNHASRFEGIAKTNLQASRASDTETLQSQVNKAAKKRLSLSGLEILHGRLRIVRCAVFPREPGASSPSAAALAAEGTMLPAVVGRICAASASVGVWGDTSARCTGAELARYWRKIKLPRYGYRRGGLVSR